MTLPPEDERLVEFLRRHRPEPPQANPDLEDHLMAAIEQPNSQPKQNRKRDRHIWCDRLAVPALAASVLLAWGGWVSWRAPSRQAAELAVVDDFLAETWYGSVYGEETDRLALNTAEPDWLFSVYATPY